MNGKPEDPTAAPTDLDTEDQTAGIGQAGADGQARADSLIDTDEQIGADEYVDELPDDLNLTGFVGPHTFPNNNRRRIPAVLYLIFGAVCLALWFIRGDDSALVNTGTLWAGIGLVAFGLYGIVAGWTLKIEESDALVTASAQVGFPVGHAAAQMVWRGWLSRPTWRILLYSAENPPARRGIVLVDGVGGGVLEWFVEDNPEDWAEFADD